MRGRPPGGDDGLTWSEPKEDGDTVTLLGSGGPFQIAVVVGFDAADKIRSIDIGPV
jgi:hypothetical protein